MNIRRAVRWRRVLKVSLGSVMAFWCCMACSTTRSHSVPLSVQPQQPPTPRITHQAPGRSNRVVENTLSNPGAPQTITHEVAPMESIWRLSKMYEVSENDIYAANHLKPGDPIQIGQKLVIPNAKALRNVVPLYANANWNTWWCTTPPPKSGRRPSSTTPIMTEGSGMGSDTIFLSTTARWEKVTVKSKSHRAGSNSR